MNQSKDYQFRPGVPRPSFSREQFAKSSTPLGAGADDSLLHVASRFSRYDSQRIPSISLVTPWRRKPKPGVAGQGEEETQTQTQTSTPTKANPARPEEKNSLAQTPFGASRSGAMEQGAQEGVVVPPLGIGGPPGASTDLQAWTHPNYRNGGASADGGGRLKVLTPISTTTRVLPH